MPDILQVFVLPSYQLPVSAVALNWQTICTEMDIMMSLFSDNGACGYILKPPVLTQGVASANLLPGIVPLDLTIKVVLMRCCELAMYRCSFVKLKGGHLFLYQCISPKYERLFQLTPRIAALLTIC